MKLSIAWIFDHIKGKWQDHDIHGLVSLLNKTTAEIEHVQYVAIQWDDFTLARVISVDKGEVVVESFDWGKEFELPFRKDVQKGAWYLVKYQDNDYVWALCSDLNSDKEGLVPTINCSEEMAYGTWREGLESEDYILELDNKSVTNRPDMWGHRGVAREVAAILGLELIPEEQLGVEHSIQHYVEKTDHNASYHIDISQSDTCTRFAGIELSGVVYTPSLLWMAHRLLRVDSRSIDAFVDMTNYVLQDIGHPMHAFDAQCIENKTLFAREAQLGEKLVLLDDECIELSPDDCIIADTDKPLSLAGIMGGKKSGVSAGTQRLFLEAAHFKATPIRLSAANHKIRTESSARFEKSLDPNNNTMALLRYMRLMKDANLSYEASGPLMSVGPLSQEKTIIVEHQFILDCLGATVTPDRVQNILRALGFGVQFDDSKYTVTVPTFRGTKDIGIKEDVVEEVGRYFGYTNIVPELPKRIMDVQDHSTVLLRRACKQHCAYALAMREVYNYALYDEDFLKKIDLDPKNSVTLKNPVSEVWSRMATSLVPGLLKNVSENCANEPHLQFFEWNRIWKMQDSVAFNEQAVCAGIWYSRTSEVDFYQHKKDLESLFTVLNIDVTWHKVSQEEQWMNKYQTAELRVGKHVIGYAGMLDESVLGKIVEGKAFVFELDASALIDAPRVTKNFVEPSKYQSISLDISMFAPYSVTVAELESAIKQSDSRINTVFLHDYFEKDSWDKHRSVTIRCVVQDTHKTMTKEDIDSVQKNIHQAVKSYGVEVR